MQKLSDTALWDLCQKYGEMALAYRRKFVALLPEVEKRRLYRRHGFYSVYEFAARVGGVSAQTVDKILNLDKKLEDKPLLKAQLAEIGWSKVNLIAKITTKENESEMIQIMKTLPKSSLEAYVYKIDTSKESCAPSPGIELQSVTFKLDAETQFLLRKYQQKLEKEKGEPVVLGQVLKALLKKADQPIKEPQKRESHSRKPSAHTRFENNNGGKCAFPGCNKPHEVFHHPKRFALDHSHDNIVPLCEEHHRLVHAGLVENEQAPPEEWKLRTEMKPNVIDKKYLQHYLSVNSQTPSHFSGGFLLSQSSLPI